MPPMQLTLTRGPSAMPRAPCPPGVTIRAIAEADLGAVGALYAVCYPSSEVGTTVEAIDDIRASWSGDYGRWSREGSLLAEADDGSLLAAVLTVEEPPWDDVEDPVFVIDLFVTPEHWRSGLGRTLVSRALTTYPDRSVGLRVDSANTPALGLYRSLGFEDRSVLLVVEAVRPSQTEVLDLYSSWAGAPTPGSRRH